jgi:alpha-1,4-digalacturonate transport system permease protein
MRKSTQLSGTNFTSKVLIYIVLVVVTVVMLFPYLWMVSTAIKPLGKAFTWPPQFIPRPLSLQNIPEAWSRSNFGRGLINSTIVAAGTTLLAVFLNSLAGFGFAKFRFRGREILFALVIATLIIPFQIIMVPLFITMRGLNLVNRYIGLILPRAADAFGIFMVKQYLQTVPNELIDAAHIDGANDFSIYWRIIVPLIRPALAVIAILTFTWRWNDLIWPLIIITSDKMKTVQLMIATFQGEYYIEWHYIMALCLISLIPMFIVFVFFQKYFVQGITLSGLKG